MSTGDFILDELLRQHAEQAEAIQRVRELAEKLQNKEAFHQLTAYACAEEILKALDGEKS